ncbi:MAG: hypothetical protein DMG06_30020 [Acidobacteria bacterium]|nr:MAG: hypothetical protein DMG06_30020 [Acidobacteriota bacterium]
MGSRLASGNLRPGISPFKISSSSAPLTQNWPNYSKKRSASAKISSSPEAPARAKTTLLNILCDFIPDEERIVVIEDTAEIHIRKSNLVRFEARRAQDSTPAITIRDLLKATLRHRPDRIIVGEIRGGEAFDFLQALNVGHSGTLSTIHANSAYHALARFVTCVLQSTIGLPYKAIKSNIGDSINLLLHLERKAGRRQVSELVEVGATMSRPTGMSSPPCIPGVSKRCRRKLERNPARLKTVVTERES